MKLFLNQKGFAPIIAVLIGIIIAGGVGVGAYFALQSSDRDNSQEVAFEMENETDFIVMKEEPKPVSQPQQISSPGSDSEENGNSCFMGPHEDSVWSLGVQQTIILNSSPVYDNHCGNEISLVNANTNTRVGHLLSTNFGQTTYTLAIPGTVTTSACGTGMTDDPSTVASITPGSYKLKFYEYDTINGAGPNTCESETFVIQ